MTIAEYEKILAALENASRVLMGNQGELSPGDIRIRSLFNIKSKEVKRALLEKIPRGNDTARPFTLQDRLPPFLTAEAVRSPLPNPPPDFPAS